MNSLLVLLSRVAGTGSAANRVIRASAKRQLILCLAIGSFLFAASVASRVRAMCCGGAGAQSHGTMVASPAIRNPAPARVRILWDSMDAATLQIGRVQLHIPGSATPGLRRMYFPLVSPTSIRPLRHREIVQWQLLNGAGTAAYSGAGTLRVFPAKPNARFRQVVHLGSGTPSGHSYKNRRGFAFDQSSAPVQTEVTWSMAAREDEASPPTSPGSAQGSSCPDLGENREGEDNGSQKGGNHDLRDGGGEGEQGGGGKAPPSNGGSGNSQPPQVEPSSPLPDLTGHSNPADGATPLIFEDRQRLGTAITQGIGGGLYKEGTNTKIANCTLEFALSLGATINPRGNVAFLDYVPYEGSSFQSPISISSYRLSRQTELLLAYTASGSEITPLPETLPTTVRRLKGPGGITELYEHTSPTPAIEFKQYRLNQCQNYAPYEPLSGQTPARTAKIEQLTSGAPIGYDSTGYRITYSRNPSPLTITETFWFKTPGLPHTSGATHKLRRDRQVAGDATVEILESTSIFTVAIPPAKDSRLVSTRQLLSRSGVDVILRNVQQRYQIFPWGEALTEHRVLKTGAAISSPAPAADTETYSTYEWWETSENDPNYASVKARRDYYPSTGSTFTIASWQAYYQESDTSGSVETSHVLSPWKSSPGPSVGATLSALQTLATSSSGSNVCVHRESRYWPNDDPDPSTTTYSTDEYRSNTLANRHETTTDEISFTTTTKEYIDASNFLATVSQYSSSGGTYGFPLEVIRLKQNQTVPSDSPANWISKTNYYHASSNTTSSTVMNSAATWTSFNALSPTHIIGTQTLYPGEINPLASFRFIDVPIGLEKGTALSVGDFDGSYAYTPLQTDWTYYDTYGRPTSTSSSTRDSESWSYSGLTTTHNRSSQGVVTTKCDGFGRILEYGRLATNPFTFYVTYPGQNALLTTYDYAPNSDGTVLTGAIVTATLTARNASNGVISSGGVPWSRVAVALYDGLGRVAGLLDHLGVIRYTTYRMSPTGFTDKYVVETRYDSGELIGTTAYFRDGNLASQTGPSRLGTVYEYSLPGAYQLTTEESRTLFNPSTGVPSGSAVAPSQTKTDGLGRSVWRYGPVSDNGSALTYRYTYFYYDDWGRLLSHTLPQPETTSNYHHKLSSVTTTSSGEMMTTYGSVSRSGTGAPSITPVTDGRRVTSSVVQIGSQWWSKEIEEILTTGPTWVLKDTRLSLLGPMPAPDYPYTDGNGGSLFRRITGTSRSYGDQPLTGNPREERVQSVQSYSGGSFGWLSVVRHDVYVNGVFRLGEAVSNGLPLLAFRSSDYTFPSGFLTYSPLLEPLSSFDPSVATSAWTNFAYSPDTGLIATRSRQASAALDQFSYYTTAESGLPSLSWVGRVKTVQSNTNNPSLGAGKPTTYYRYNARGQITQICGTGADPAQYEYEDYLGRPVYMRTYAAASASAFASGWPASPPSPTSTTYWEYVIGSPVLKSKQYQSSPTGQTGYTWYGDGSLKERVWSRLVNGIPLKTTYTYDAYHRLNNITYSDLLITPGVAFTYNEAGRVATRSDGDGARVTTYTWRPDGQMELESIASSGATRHAGTVNPGYNTKGERTTLDATLGGHSSPQVVYGYSSLGRLDSVTSDNRSVGTYSYSSYDEQWSSRYFKHGTTNVLRDTRGFQSSGRVSSITHTGYAPSGSPTSETLHTFNYYYDYERLYATKREEGKWYYEYDPTSQVQGANKQQGNPSNGVTSPPALSSAIPGTGAGYDYDLLGNRTSITENGGGGATTVPVTYSRNAQNQYSSVTTGQAITVYGKRKTSTTEIKVNNTALSPGDYVPVGTGLYFWKSVPHSTPGLYEQITVTAQETSPLGPVETVENGQEYVPPTSFTPVYDADGNLKNDGRWTYTWDAENRLIGLECSPGTTPAATAPGWRYTFTYDGLSRRIGKLVEKMAYGTSTWVKSDYQTYLYDGWNLIMILQVNDNNSPRGRTASYVWGPDIGSQTYAQSHWQRAGGVGGLLMVIDGVSTSRVYPTAGSEDPNDDYYFPLQDRLGNITGYRKAVANTPSAQLDAVFEYDAFGRELFASGPAADKLPFRFSSKFTDLESGFNYYGYRYYDPRWGRWLNRDPIEEEGGGNLYGFVGNDGTNQIDVLGNAPTGKPDPVRPRILGGCGSLRAHLRVLKQNLKLADTLPSVYPHHQQNPFQHCVWNCRMTRANGREFAEKKSWEKERKDVEMAKLRDNMMSQGCWDDLSESEQDWIKGHAESAMQPSDFDDNRAGRDCGEGLCPIGSISRRLSNDEDCENCFRSKGINENTKEGPTTKRPYGPYTQPGSTNGMPKPPRVTPPHLR